MTLGGREEGGAQHINTRSCQVRFVSSYYCQVFCTPQGEQERNLEKWGRRRCRQTSCRDRRGRFIHLTRETVKLPFESWVYHSRRYMSAIRYGRGNNKTRLTAPVVFTCRAAMYKSPEESAWGALPC